MNQFLSKKLAASAGMSVVILCAALPANGGETLAGIKKRGMVRCGVSEGIAGFSARNGAGRWCGVATMTDTRWFGG
jgi:hypothetical protein